MVVDKINKMLDSKINIMLDDTALCQYKYNGSC